MSLHLPVPVNNSRAGRSVLLRPAISPLSDVPAYDERWITLWAPYSYPSSFPLLVRKLPSLERNTWQYHLRVGTKVEIRNYCNCKTSERGGIHIIIYVFGTSAISQELKQNFKKAVTGSMWLHWFPLVQWEGCWSLVLVCICLVTRGGVLLLPHLHLLCETRGHITAALRLCRTYKTPGAIDQCH